MAGLEAAMLSASGHLLSFKGTDTFPVLNFLQEYYKADTSQVLVGSSVPATEHSVMCMGTLKDEIETFRRLITELYSSGVISIVSDTWDLWKVLRVYLPELKQEILCREGKVVIRPDSGDPVKILCGDPSSDDMAVRKGVVELLWDVFSGKVNDKGFKELDTHIGAIYGDGITLERADEICFRLKEKGFASTNVVLGLGSYTYQYRTRDTFSFAMKSTYGEVNTEARSIYKDPITDNGMKRSAKGLLKVDKVNDTYVLKDQVSWEEESQGALQEVFRDGVLLKDVTLDEVRSRM